MTKELFRKALKKMLEEGEFEKIINCATSKRERKNAELDFAMLKSVSERCDIEEFPIIPLLRNLNSIETFRDVISHMIDIEAKLLGETK